MASRDGTWVAEATGIIDLSTWPDGMRLIVRKENSHPGAQLRFTDTDGLRLTASVTNTIRGQLPDLELRHRRRARCEYRIRTAKDTGLASLPLYGWLVAPVHTRFGFGQTIGLTTSKNSNPKPLKAITVMAWIFEIVRA